MIYETGTAVDATDLLSKVELFLSGCGWTVDRSEWLDSGDSKFGRRLHVHKGGLFFHLRSAIERHPVNMLPYTFAGRSFLSLYGSDAYGTGIVESMHWELQPTAPQTLPHVTHAQMSVGELTYRISHSDSGPDAFHLSIEDQTGAFSYLAFGELSKAGSWTGGAFYSGTGMADGISSTVNQRPFSEQSFWVRVDHPDLDGWFMASDPEFGDLVTSLIAGAGVPRYHIGGAPFGCSGSNGDSFRGLMPVLVYGRTGGVLRPLGHVPGVWLADSRAFGKAEDYLGQFVVVPASRESNPSDAYAGTLGLAIATGDSPVDPDEPLIMIVGGGVELTVSGEEIAYYG